MVKDLIIIKIIIGWQRSIMTSSLFDIRLSSAGWNGVYIKGKQVIASKQKKLQYVISRFYFQYILYIFLRPDSWQF